MDDKEPLTKKRLRNFGILATAWSLLGVWSIFDFFIFDNETGQTWWGFAVIPVAIWLWAVVVRRVESQRLEILACIAAVVVLLVGWYRTNDVILTYTLITAFAFATIVVIGGWFNSRR